MPGKTNKVLGRQTFLRSEMEPADFIAKHNLRAITVWMITTYDIQLFVHQV